METQAVYIKATSDTEGLIQAIIEEFKATGMSEDDALDAIEIDREHAQSGGVANEPVTVAVILTFATTLTIAAARAIEKWIRAKHHEKMLELLIVTQESKPLDPGFVDIMKKFAEVDIKTDKFLPTLGNQH